HSYQQYQAEFAESRQALLDASFDQLHANRDAMVAARGLYERNCSACHGPDGEGQASRFPNLVDDAWQWGGSVEQIDHTIRYGRQAAMPPWAAALGEDGVREVATYVQSMAKIAGEAHPGRIKYTQFCVACHGPNGEGNPALGAPNLADDAWLYGNSLSEISVSLTEGRNGVMPAFGNQLDDVQIRLLTAWLTRPR
ncbi:MAG: c-type cytochrome, partial [Xanthomonadales bacterium]|nr:c-type cytochrome [Xanthomonadales bacterium]